MFVLEVGMNRTLLLYGFGLWLVGTIILRLAGQYLLHPGSLASTLFLFALSFVAMAWLARRLCVRLGLPPEQWPAGAVSLALPTLLLDPFSTAFFPAVFPNMAPASAGLFGGWMLFCCAGALVGATIRATPRATVR
jgi:Family of unknown function (DUF5367)